MTNKLKGLRGHGNEYYNLLGSQCGPDVLISAYGPITSLASLPILPDYISFCGLSIFLKQIISKQIKQIDNLLIFSFSLSKQFGFQEKKVVLNWIW